MSGSTTFQKYILPGLVFQSIIIGGGYGTGREMAEFFMSQGPVGGMMGMLVSSLIMSVVLALTFELCRRFQTFDYRTFMQRLIGRGWYLFEVIYLIMLVLIVSVMGSAAGELLEKMLGWPQMVGIVVLITAVGAMAFFGNDLIEKVFSVWSFALYFTFFAVIVVALVMFGDRIGAIITDFDSDSKWLMSGITYAGYNVGLAPCGFFVLRHLSTQKEAISSGLIAGALGMIPAFFVFVAMLAVYPEVLTESIPVDLLLVEIGSPWLRVLFQVVLFGTLIETGVGVIHGFNERVAGVYREKGKEMPPGLRIGIAAVLLLMAIFLADAIGIVDLISKGYGTLTWGYWAVYLIPVLIIGVWRIWFKKDSTD